MLQSLHIEQFTLIDRLDLSLSKGMTALTGETGAGKSITIDALSLALGARADASFVRKGAKAAHISACFDVSKNSEVQTWLAAQGLSDDECILRRTISSDGRTRGFINGQPVPIQQLRELGQQLVDIHGQHEYQSLLKSEAQQQWLDHYGQHATLATKVSQLYHEWSTCKKTVTALQAEQNEQTEKLAWLTHQLEELQQAELQEGEWDQLYNEHKQQHHATELLERTTQINQILAEAEVNASSILQQAINMLHPLMKLDEHLAEPAKNLEQAHLHLQEASHALARYQQSKEHDPQRFAHVEQRMTKLWELARKYRCEPQELPAILDKRQTEFNQTSAIGDQLAQAQQALVEIEARYQQSAAKLSQARRRAAKKLEPLVTQKLHELAIAGGELHVRHHELKEPSMHGLEKVEFWITTNPGHPPEPLAKIASGGELSRISLAIQVLMADQTDIPCLIFDEVDVGIGGQTAAVVGRMLRLLGERAQVLCVTHQPQVAAQANQHWRVHKYSDKQGTHTRVTPLNKDERIQEIARMVGGETISDTALKHAEALMD